MGKKEIIKFVFFSDQGDQEKLDLEFAQNFIWDWLKR